MPNFASLPHLSPLILFSEAIPTYFLSAILVWITMSALFVAILHVIKSWHNKVSAFQIIPATAMALSPVIVYLLLNDWSLNLVGLLSSIGLMSLLLHKSFNSSSTSKSLQPGQTASSALGVLFLSLLLSGHPRMLFLSVPLVFALPRQCKTLVQAVIRSRVLRVCAFLIVTQVCLIVLEYRALGLGDDAFRAPYRSSLDLFDPERESSFDLVHILKLLAVNFALPLLRLISGDQWSLMNSRIEFLNAFMLAAVALTATLRRKSGISQSVVPSVVRTFLVLVIWMMFGSLITRTFSWTNLLFLQDGWDLSYMLGYLGALGGAITIFGQSNPSNRIVSRDNAILVTTRILFVVGSIMALVFALGLFRQSPVLQGEIPRRDWSLATTRVGTSHLKITWTENLGRAGWTEPRESNEGGCVSRPTWEHTTGLSHPLVLAREGVAVIESSPAFRSSQVSLRTPEDQDNYSDAGVCDTLLDVRCSTRVLDFLSFRSLAPLYHHQTCTQFWKSAAADNQNSFSPVDRLKTSTDASLGYHNFFVVPEDSKMKPAEWCGLFSGCLDQARVSITTQLQPPWALCRKDCWFTYEVLEVAKSQEQLLLLPARYDDALVIRPVDSPRVALPAISYRGLVAVDISSLKNPTSLRIEIDPDLRFYSIAILPYMTLAIFGGLVIVLRNERTRAKRRVRDI
jgi:hypothetical protein